MPRIAFPKIMKSPPRENSEMEGRLPYRPSIASRRTAPVLPAIRLQNMWRHFKLLRSGVVILSLLLTSCATPPLPEESEPVVALMAQRLQLAHDIAWAKWAGGFPVRDPARETAVLEKLILQGEAAGIDEVLVSHFVRAQIEASCLEQEAWMEKWRKGTPPPAGEPPTLDSLRKQIDRLSSLLIAEWAAAITTPRAAAKQHLLKSVTNPRSATVAASGFFNAQP